MEKIKICAMAPFEIPWSNVEFAKECIVLPYLLYKNHGYDVTLVCKAPEGVPAGLYDENDRDVSLEEVYPNYRYVRGLKVRFLESGDEAARAEYVKEHLDDIDVLYLRGAYELNISLAPVYRELKPEGKIICPLDANSFWMDRIYWYLPKFTKFMESCDLLTTSCTAMADFLSVKWPWHIHCLRNGFYDLSGSHKTRVPFENRENMILTVGRLGTMEKANDVLLQAFANVAAQIPEWKLCLVGDIDEGFLPFLDKFFEDNEDIADRIIFTGGIYDRDELATAYERCKIYVQTSLTEGGTNNATAEALGRGLVPVTTRIDAYEDITDNGNLGRSFEKNDIDGLSKILVDLCCNTDLKKESEKVYEYAEKEYSMEKIAGKLNEFIKNI